MVDTKKVWGWDLGGLGLLFQGFIGGVEGVS